MLEKAIYNVALYIRLSKEDVDRGYDESESITNQRALLLDYVNKLGDKYKLIDIYIDQGYTGTNFDRPSFIRMMQDINLKKINTVITKDLSRLGRDYIETGEYIEKIFPEKNVRYISVTDGIDTFAKDNGNNEIAPFKSILNDMYSKDLSKKIRTALHTMQKQGKWVAANAPFGYMKDPNDKNKLVICEEEAEIVKTIFNMALAGNKLYTIRDYLTEHNMPTRNKIRKGQDTFWQCKTIKQILRNEVYTGSTVQNKVSKISYKNKKLRPNPREEWNIVENTHTPIIDKQSFDLIQKMIIVQKYDRNKKSNFFLLDGLLFCYECHHKMGIRQKTKSNRYYMTCNYYRRYSKLNLCTSHGFSYDNLEELVLKKVRELFLNINNEKVKGKIKNSNYEKDYTDILKKLKYDIEKQEDNLDMMYIDKLNNNISKEMYERLSNKIKNEIKIKQDKYNDILNNLDNEEYYNDENLDKVIKEFFSLRKPTPELMKVIINKIYVHQDKQIDIIFNFKKLNNM